MITDAYKRGYQAGYFQGRMDAQLGREYDARTPKERAGEPPVTMDDFIKSLEEDGSNAES